jgi:uncharacterized protein (DUF4415 family)
MSSISRKGGRSFPLGPSAAGMHGEREQGSRKNLLERARAARDAISDEEDVAIRSAAEADPDARPVNELLKRKRGRPRLANAKQPILLRLDPDVVERFKAGGDGWQTRMNDALRKAVNLD